MQVFIRVHVEFVVTVGQIYQAKTVGFQNTKIATVKNKREENGNEGISIYLMPLMRGPSMKKIC